MLYSVDDFVGPITLEQRDELDMVLKPGERILWATRPKASMLHAWQGYRSSFYLFVIPFLLFGVCAGALVVLHYAPLVVDGAGDWSDIALCLFPILLGATAFRLSGRRLLSMLRTFFGIRHYRRHTLYVLTDQRAISLEPRPEGWVTRSYTLDEDMLLERRKTLAGEELIFRVEDSSVAGHVIKRGWPALDDADEAEARVRAALEGREKRGEGGAPPSGG